MQRFTLSLILMFSLSIKSYSQNISGILKDSVEKIPISNASIQIIGLDSAKFTSGTVSNINGSFTLTGVQSGTYFITVTSSGYNQFRDQIKVERADVNLGEILISKGAKTLSAIIIDGSPPPVRQKGDTLEYAANQYKVNPDANAEDLIKKMPGVTVDRQGTVTAQGETVKKVTVDGRDFFGDDATATLRNLPSEVIDKIQVFDKLSDQAQLTGFDDGNTSKSINIVTKKDMRNGNFGRIYAGYGTDNRYSSGGNVSFFNNNQRISLVGLFNNVNQQNFSSQDLLGVTSSGNRGGGGRRGGGGGGNFRGGGSDNFLVGQQNGISKTNAAGINYSDLWGKKIEVTGSYFFNNSNINNSEQVNRENFITKDSSQFYDENTLSTSMNNNSRANVRMNYKIDSSNTILFTSSLNFQNNTSANDIYGIQSADPSNILSSTDYSLNTKTSGYNFSNGLIYRHAFPKRGRSISIGFNTNLSNRDGSNYLTAFNTFYKQTTAIADTVQQFSDQRTNSNQFNLNLSYTEPIGKKTTLQINYRPSFQTNHADQMTYVFDNVNSKYSLLDTSLSNKFDNTYNSQNAGITYRTGDRDNMIAAGLSYQYSELKSDQVFPKASQIDKSFSNLLPNAFARLKLSASSNLRLIYRGSVDPPSVNQLQNVINNSNQFYYTTGNPDLRQQYTNNLITRYTYTNSVNGISLFANVFLQSTKDYVSNAVFTAVKSDSMLTNTITLYKGSQISKPVNLDGYVSARSFFTLGLPLKFIKSTFNFNAGLGYSRLPGLINNVSNIADNYNYNLGGVLASNISEYIDFTLSYTGNINIVENSLRPELNNNYFVQTAGVTLNLLSKKGTFLQNDLSNQSYTGLTDGFNQLYWLWNIGIGQKFLKSNAGELKLSVFDLLKQNRSITRNVTESYIEDVKNQVLQQYFMLTFTYKLKNFGNGKASAA